MISAVGEYTTPILFADDTNLICCGNDLGVMVKEGELWVNTDIYLVES